MSDFEGFDLDRTTARAWSQLQDRLAEHLAAMEEDDSLVIDVEAANIDEADGAYPYVQFAAAEDELRFEVSSNQYLASLHQLGPYDEKYLIGLGLNPPDLPGDEPDGEGSPNWFLDAPQDDADRLAVLAVQALRDAFGVPHPAFLRTGDLYEDATPREEGIEIDPDEAYAAVIPRNRAHLQELVDAALTPVFGHAPEHDDDGDIPVTFGSALLFVRVLEGVPVVQLFSSVVEGVTELERAAFEVGVLNRDSGFLRYVLVGDRVMAFLQIPAYPFVPAHLRAMVSLMSEAADAVDDDLAVRVGGRPSLEPEPAETEVWHERAEDHGHPAVQTLLELDADDPGSVDPELAAGICGHDRPLILELLQWVHEQETMWRNRRDVALVSKDADHASEADAEMLRAERISSLLRRALRIVVESERKARQEPGSSRTRYRRQSRTDEGPTLFDADGEIQ